MSRITLAFPVLVAASTMTRVSAQAADCNWRVTGKLAVTDAEDAYANRPVARPLVGVKVQVAATLYGWGGFTTWDTVETDSAGRFQIVQRKSCSARRFRVWAKLDSADLQVSNGDGGEWMLLRDDASNTFTRPLSSNDLGAFTFATGAPGILGDRFAVRRAITWATVALAMDWLEDRDPWLGFRRKLHVRYPANTPGGSSWAAIDTAYIHADEVSDQWDRGTVMHEAMHVWNYDHNSGITNWLAAVIGDHSTHSEQENANIAFHEGFAEFAAWQLLQEIDPTRYVGYRDASYLAFPTLAQIERNDDAVTSTLALLEGAMMPLADLLLCFRGNAALGWPKDLELGNADAGLLMFLDRCNDLSASFTDAEYASLLKTIDPQ